LIPVKYFYALLSALALGAVSCQRIPPSVSIPSYGEKKSSEEKTESKHLGSAENPPEFFPSQGQE
jgi:hypothetical protein